MFYRTLLAAAVSIAVPTAAHADETTTRATNTAVRSLSGTLRFYGTVDEESDRQVDFFATPNNSQTLVVAASNTSGDDAIIIDIVDGNGDVVAESTQEFGVSRCMLTTSERGYYGVRVRSSNGVASYRLRLTSISHADVLGTAMAGELAKAAVGGILVKLFGDDDDMSAYEASLRRDAARDAVGISVLEALLHVQRAYPNADPLIVADNLRTLVGSDDRRFINMTRSAVEELAGRLRGASVP